MASTKLKELKAEAYKIAKVTSSLLLKAKYPQFSTMDLRLKKNWGTIVEELNQLPSEENTEEQIAELKAKIAELEQLNLELSTKLEQYEAKEHRRKQVIASNNNHYSQVEEAEGTNLVIGRFGS